MKRRDKKKLRNLIPDENLTKNFEPDEIEKINQLVSDIHKIRKLSVNREGFVDIEEQINMILEQQFYFIGDFIITSGWQNNKNKIEALYNYLKVIFS